MNTRLLKSKRIEHGLLQSDLATMLGITPKTVSQKENSTKCKFTICEILELTKNMKLSFKEFDSIFFDGKLTDCIKK